ncbi:alpha/beta fold hydrolase [Amycolatopsis alkalitolerans]|uniref:Alpha/beta hydrolase n=1 Tax=Amycolatopsis alkalitolerans TaxID=2547244 RepID=A0A5C4M9Z5_9PSEU|nr:alpha/beta hydrolase [Amycolatopsis alkalitolerans]TNC28628.1 alpha/beta hydrolase [Amycolatopsis alkalitolerans]
MTTQERRATLPQGEVRYYEQGTGRPIVFVHGVLTNAKLWRKVAPAVAEAGFRCITPDWPLGSHELPMRAAADLSPVGQAEVIADFLDALDLHDVTLVANDTGGALTQIMLSRRPDRVARVVLTPSDSFDYFFPNLFKPLTALARVPGSMLPLSRLVRIRALWPLPFLFGWVVKHPLPREIAEAYLRPFQRSPGVRRDLRKLLRGVDSRLTLAAADKLRTFDRPVLLVWGSEEKLFPLKLAHRLAGVFPDARLVTVPDTYTFISEDQPEVLVQRILEFMAGFGTCDAPSKTVPTAQKPR